jgi:hypothetical protein
VQIRADGYRDVSAERLRALRDELSIARAFAQPGDARDWITGHLTAVDRELAAREGQ